MSMIPEIVVGGVKEELPGIVDDMEEPCLLGLDWCRPQKNEDEGETICCFLKMLLNRLRALWVVQMLRMRDWSYTDEA
ncbi:hypothetical protein E2C01_006437 [Portunus trituberculatus]|uniref:Uncharacterized protein n=1 Tax=Portunus trituberculatus TaxID=210409 RepID=A0A5B7CY71_PORTR|nr:hypothetical protein [Portunus trituberculatus]